MSRPVEVLPKRDWATEFDQIAAHVIEHADPTPKAVEKFSPENGRITVMLDLPHLAQYGIDPIRELVYGCRFKVAIGDTVLCPPTPLYSKWTTGVVVALHGRGYKGRVKYVKEIA